MSVPSPSPSLASTSLLPHATMPATYHPSPRPSPSNSLHSLPSSQIASQSYSQSQSHVHDNEDATYHQPLVNPRQGEPIPFERMDTHSIKQELHDALGEDGLPYWKAVNGYLLGQIGRGELEGMVRSWFKGEKVSLHNKLLLSLLNNASAPPASHTPISSLTAQKRKRVGIDHEEYDIDDTYVESKKRVKHWMLGLGSRERARIRKAAKGQENGLTNGSGMPGANGDVDGRVAEEERLGKSSAWNTFNPVQLLPPLASSSRHLPSSTQLSLRLSQYAKQQSLSLAPDAIGDIGEFLAVGVDSHLGDVFHSLVSLTGRDRPNGATIRIPHGDLDRIDKARGGQREINGNALVNGHADGSDERRFNDSTTRTRTPGGLPNDRINGTHDTEGWSKGYMDDIVKGAGGDLPKPDLNTLQHLFFLNPSIHPQASPALHRLQTSQTMIEAEWSRPKLTIKHDQSQGQTDENGDTQGPVRGHSQSSREGFGNVNGRSVASTNGIDSSGKRDGNLASTSASVSRAPGGDGVKGGSSSSMAKSEMVAQNLIGSGLLKLDKAGRQSEIDAGAGADAKKERKHNLHWKYEDPAMILQDILG